MYSTKQEYHFLAWEEYLHYLISIYKEFLLGFPHTKYNYIHDIWLERGKILPQKIFKYFNKMQQKNYIIRSFQKICNAAFHGSLFLNSFIHFLLLLLWYLYFQDRMYDAIGYFTYSVVRALKGHRHALIFLRLERP